MVRPDIVKVWALGVLVFFAAEALSEILTGLAAQITAIIAVACYVLVGLYTFAPERERVPERPSTARARAEAARRSRQQQ